MQHVFILDKLYKITYNNNGGGKPESFIATFVKTTEEDEHIFKSGDEIISVYEYEIGPDDGQCKITLFDPHSGGRTKKNTRSKKQKRNRRQTKNTRLN
jgi:hypothetical protein